MGLDTPSRLDDLLAIALTIPENIGVNSHSDEPVLAVATASGSSNSHTDLQNNCADITANTCEVLDHKEQNASVQTSNEVVSTPADTANLASAHSLAGAAPIPAPADVEKPAVNLNVAVNSLDALMSAVSNLNSIMDPRAKIAKKVQDNERKNSIAARLVVSSDGATAPKKLLPDSILPLAQRVFTYIDALKEHEAIFDEEHQKEDKDRVNSQLIEARTKARTVVSQAVSMGVAERDYVPTEVEVQSDAADETDPFAGGSSASLHVVADVNENVPLNEPAPSYNDDALSRNEVLSIVSAVHDDIKTHAEDDSAGEREKAVANIIPQIVATDPVDSATPSHDDPISSENTAIAAETASVADNVGTVAEDKTNDTLYVDGVALSSDLVEGQREGESVEEMLRRVQQTALEQLRQDDALNGPHSDNLDTTASVIANSNDVSSEKETNANAVQKDSTVYTPSDENKLPSSDTAVSLSGIDESKNQGDLNTSENKAKAQNATAVLKEQETPEITLDATGDDTSKNKVAVVLLDDPYGDEPSSHEDLIVDGTCLNDAIAFSQKQDSSVEVQPQESRPDVVGECLRAQLAKLNSNSQGPSQNSKLSVPSANVGAVGTLSSDAVSSDITDAKGLSASDLASLDKEMSTLPISDEDSLSDAEFDDEEDETFDNQVTGSTVYHDFDERDAQSDVGSTSGQGIQVLPDGRTDDVPIAERMERERIENADKIAAGRALEPDDYIDDVIKSDPWGCDFVQAGYSEGAVFSALCASVRCIDPTDPNHWIVVMSDSFKIFAIDPNFVNGLMERFSSLKKHHIEISIQLSQGFPQGSPRDLCVKAFGAASEKARQDLVADPAVQQIAQLAGADLRYCAVRLFALSSK